MEAVTTKRPERWDEPFGDSMTAEMVDSVLSHSPFREMDSSGFPKKLSLRDIVQNDSRVVDYQEGDIVIREGDYGNSAFLVLDGCVDVSLTSLPENLLGRATPRRQGWFRALASFGPIQPDQNSENRPMHWETQSVLATQKMGLASFARRASSVGRKQCCVYPTGRIIW